MKWLKLQDDRMLWWTGTNFTTTYAAVSHQIMDLQQKDHFQRKRGNNKKSCCDSMLWLGWYHEIAWLQK